MHNDHVERGREWDNVTTKVEWVLLRSVATETLARINLKSKDNVSLALLHRSSLDQLPFLGDIRQNSCVCFDIRLGHRLRAQP